MGEKHYSERKMHESEWLEKRLSYIRGLKAPNEQQKMLLQIAENPTRTAEDQRKRKVLIRAEKAAERALKARGEVAKIISAEQQVARNKRNHELYKAAGLLVVAGIVDNRTGKLVIDAGTLVGALLALKESPPGDRVTLKGRGDAAIAAREAGRNKPN